MSNRIRPLLLVMLLLVCMMLSGFTYRHDHMDDHMDDHYDDHYDEYWEEAYEDYREDHTAHHPSVPRDAQAIITEMVEYYGFYQDAANERVAELLYELETQDAVLSSRWRQIMDYWRYTTNQMPISYGTLPAGLPTDNSLCLVVLGFALNADGSIRPELEQRLNTVLACAKQYPNAYILCTGGGTAAQNPDVTEASQMAMWLINSGISTNRIIVEKASMTTGQNAINSMRILRTEYPQITNLAVVSSDYHIPWGAVLFEGAALLSQDYYTGRSLHVTANAGCSIPDHKIYPVSIQAAGLLEMIGAYDAANHLYCGTMEAPPLY